MMTKNTLPVIVLLSLMAACKPGLKPDQLYGTWNYIKVSNPNQTPPDSVSNYDLQLQSPSIKFEKNDNLIITWGGKLLSQGKFTTSHQNIDYTEDIPGGKRKFPFYVSKISDTSIVFETLGEDGTRVTAIKKK